MSFTAQLKGAESQYKLVNKVVHAICESNKLDFDTVWSTISNRECEYFNRHFKRQKRRDDPLRQVKKPRTAFSFFTQANRNEIQTKLPNLAFGEVSKVVGEQWRGLDDKSRAKYIQLETDDKARYALARNDVMVALASQLTVPPPTEPLAATSVPAPKKTRAAKPASAPVETNEAVTSASEPVKAKKTKAVTTVSVPVVSAPVECAPVVASADKKEKKPKTVQVSAPTAPVQVAVASAVNVVAVEAPKKEKKTKSVAAVAK